MIVPLILSLTSATVASDLEVTNGKNQPVSVTVQSVAKPSTIGGYFDGAFVKLGDSKVLAVVGEKGISFLDTSTLQELSKVQFSETSSPQGHDGWILRDINNDGSVEAMSSFSSRDSFSVLSSASGATLWSVSTASPERLGPILPIRQKEGNDLFVVATGLGKVTLLDSHGLQLDRATSWRTNSRFIYPEEGQAIVVDCDEDGNEEVLASSDGEFSLLTPTGERVWFGRPHPRSHWVQYCASPHPIFRSEYPIILQVTVSSRSLFLEDETRRYSLQLSRVGEVWKETWTEIRSEQKWRLLTASTIGVLVKANETGRPVLCFATGRPNESLVLIEMVDLNGEPIGSATAKLPKYPVTGRLRLIRSDWLVADSVVLLWGDQALLCTIGEKK